MLQMIVILAVFVALIIPLGTYLYHIAERKHTFADPVFDRVDGVIYKVCGINPDKGMNWKKYALSFSTGKCRNGFCRVFDFADSISSNFQSKWN